MLKRLLTVGHSYVVSLNRRLAHELSCTGPKGWEVTVCAPKTMRGDLRRLTLSIDPKEPCQIIPVRLRRSKTVHLMGYDSELKHVLSQKWDLVHAWEEPYIYCGSQIARWSAHNPLIYYTYQNIRKNYPPPFNWFERSSIRSSAGWIAGGQTTEQAMIGRTGYADRPHCIIPLGVDVHHFIPDKEAGAEIRRKLGWDSEGPPVVGYMGRFVPEKGLRVFMQALDACESPWRALFLGGGPMRFEIERWGARYPNRVAVVNSVPHDQVPNYLNAMDFLAAPSQTTPHWREQFGRMLIEGFACGLPVIASDSGEIPNVLADAGVILPENDIPAWTAKIEELLSNPQLRNQMAQDGLQRAHAEFAWSVIARKHWQFFETVLDSRYKESATKTSDDNGTASATCLSPSVVEEPRPALSHTYSPPKPRKLLSIGHSYVLHGNRVLAHELHKQSGGKWDVTVVAPRRFIGRNDIRPLSVEQKVRDPIRFEPIESRLSNRVHFFHYSRRLSSILSEGFDLVHAWEEPYITAGLQIAHATPKNVPLVFRTAQSLPKKYLPPFNWVEQYCVERMAGWIFSGRLVENNLLQRPGYANRPRCHAPLGFSTNSMYVDKLAGETIRKRFGWSLATPVIGYLGRFVPEKGLQVLMDALDQIHVPWNAMLVGNGPLLPQLETWAAKYPGRVALCTEVKHTDVVYYLNAMDVLAAPSLTMPNWREQFGRMMIEAFACGVPVIGSDSGEIPFVVRDSGMIVPENNSANLGIAITRLLGEPETRKAMAEKGLHRAHAEYTWPGIARKTLAFFDELADTK